MTLEGLELEKVSSLIRREIETSEIAKKISELDSKLLELKKAVEGIVIELTYIKSELKELRENSGGKRLVQNHLKEGKVAEKPERPEKQLKVEEAKFDLSKKEKTEIEKKAKAEEEDLIICD